MPASSLLLAALATMIPVRVRAEPPETPAEASERLAWEGVEAYEAQDYALAFERFSAARATSSKDPLLLYYLGRAADRLGDAKSAIASYEEYLRVGPDAANVAQVRASLDRLRSTLPGAIEASCRPSATLAVSGVPGGAPCPGRLEPVGPGTVEVSVEAPGYEPWSGPVEVMPGEVSRVEVVLEALPGRLAVAALPAGASVTLDGEPMGLTPLPASPVRPGRHLVALAKEGYEPALREVEVLPGASLTVRLELRRTSVPLEPAAPAPVPEAAPGRAEALVRGVVAGAFAAAAVAGMVVSAGVHSTAVADGRRAAGVDRNAYAEAKDTAETAGLAYYGLGGVAAAACGYAVYVWLGLPGERSSAAASRWGGGAWAWTW